MARRPVINPQQSLGIAAQNTQLDIVNAVQERVEAWAAAGYPGTSDLTLRLFQHWFGDPHLLKDTSGGEYFFKYHAHQQRAVETAVWLYEVEGLRRTEQYADLAGEKRAAQRSDWAKIGLQLATGSGKTKVMSLLMVWAHLHWQQETPVAHALGMSNTMLLIAPNLIVLERLLEDFAGGKIFRTDPLLPPEYRRQWQLKVVGAADAPEEWNEYDSYLIVTNIHKLFGIDDTGDSPNVPTNNTLALDFENSTPKTLDLGAPNLLRFLRGAGLPVLVFNDEAHHVHDEAVHYSSMKTEDDETGDAVAWNRVLSAVRKRSGLAIQFDLSATLFEENTKVWFRHTVYDFPLKSAIENGIVKQPYMVKVGLRVKEEGNAEGADDKGYGSDDVPNLIDESAPTAFQRYSVMIQAGITKWKVEQKKLDDAGLERKILLFIVCNDRKDAADIAERLEVWEDPETKEVLFRGKVIEIHIGKKEHTNDKEWQKIRDDIKKVDRADSPYSVVVSVMMLKEGWDVKNIKVIVPLRPSNSRQLTEQLLGRGLRRMFMPSWTAEGERVETGIREGLYIIPHESFARVVGGVRDILPDEPDISQPSVGVVVKMVEPDDERFKRDLPISRITGAFAQGDDWPEKIGGNTLPPLTNRWRYVQELKEIEGIIQTESMGSEPRAEDPERTIFDLKQVQDFPSMDAALNQAYCEPICREQRLSYTYLASVKRIVKNFLERCTFDLRGFPFNIDAAMDADEETRRIVIYNLCRPNVVQQVRHNVAKIIGEARSGHETPDVEVDTIRAAKNLREYETTLKKNYLENPLKCVHTLCCFDSADELYLARFLDEAEDVAAWLWNDQSGVGYRIQYTFEGRTPYYYPDFLVRLNDGTMVIVESKGSERTRDIAKARRAERYAKLLSDNNENQWRYLYLMNDPAMRREDIKWWGVQGRRRFSDLIAHADNWAGSGTSAINI